MPMPDQAAMIDAMASAQMGVPPQMPQTPADPAAAAAALTPPNDRQKAKAGEKSTQDAAQTKGSPATEGDKMSADAVTYEVAFGEGDVRKLTPTQIKGTMERYAALNHQNANYKPVHDLVEQILAANPGAKPEHVAAHFEAILKGGERNPTMGQDANKGAGDGDKDGKSAPNMATKAQSPDDMQAAMKKWEEENAATLPPGYAEMMGANAQGGSAMAQMQQQMQQMQRMMEMVLGQSAGVADAARSGMETSQGMQVDATRNAIANNIDRTQMELQLPDEAAQDFQIFAAERGYTMEDFINPQLTRKVMQDFKNEMSGPEMERMRNIAQRRQAYTGSIGSSPGGAGGGGGAGGAPTTFDQMTDAAMQKRMG